MYDDKLKCEGEGEGFAVFKGVKLLWEKKQVIFYTAIKQHNYSNFQ